MILTEDQIEEVTEILITAIASVSNELSTKKDKCLMKNAQPDGFF